MKRIFQGAGSRRSFGAKAARNTRTSLLVTGGALCVIMASVAAAGTLHQPLAGGQARQVPLFDVDPFWPKPLPDHWLIGSAVGLAVDARDRVFVVHRTDSFNRRTEIGAATDPPTGDCCLPAPAVLSFDTDGNLLSHWGGPGDLPEWPAASHRIAFDDEGDLWLGGVGDGDVSFRTFSPDGRLLRTGSPGVQATSIAFHPRSGEAYAVDATARQVVVLDAASGNVIRSWGAYGRPADTTVQLAPYTTAAPPAPQFRNAFCVTLSDDGHVYVCDRESNRIQVFRTDGSFVTEALIAPATLGEGAVWDIAFSRDGAQQFMYVADGSSMRVHVLDRATLEVLTAFGSGGRQPGQFYGVHSIATDSRGNVYTAETYEGKRVQKFIFRGLGPAPARDQGTVWPRR
jgi:DNA-binding beta-propeller fold protein YncE